MAHCWACVIEPSVCRRRNSVLVSPDQPRPLLAWAERPGRWWWAPQSCPRQPPCQSLGSICPCVQHCLPATPQWEGQLSCPFLEFLFLNFPVAQMTTSLGAAGEDRQDKHGKQAWWGNSMDIGIHAPGWRAGMWPGIFSRPGARLPGFFFVFLILILLEYS